MGLSGLQIGAALFAIAVTISVTVALLEAWAEHRRQRAAHRAEFDARLEQWRAAPTGRHRGQQ